MFYISSLPPRKILIEYPQYHEQHGHNQNSQEHANNRGRSKSQGKTFQDPICVIVALIGIKQYLQCRQRNGEVCKSQEQPLEIGPEERLVPRVDEEVATPPGSLMESVSGVQPRETQFSVVVALVQLLGVRYAGEQIHAETVPGGPGHGGRKKAEFEGQGEVGTVVD